MKNLWRATESSSASVDVFWSSSIVQGPVASALKSTGEGTSDHFYPQGFINGICLEIISDTLLMELANTFDLESPSCVVQLCCALGSHAGAELVGALRPRAALLSALLHWREVCPLPTREALSFVLKESGHPDQALLLNPHCKLAVPS